MFTSMPAAAPARTPRRGLPVIRLTRKPTREPMEARPSRPICTRPARWEYSSASARNMRGVAILTLARRRFDMNSQLMLRHLLFLCEYPVGKGLELRQLYQGKARHGKHYHQRLYYIGYAGRHASSRLHSG